MRFLKFALGGPFSPIVAIVASDFDDWTVPDFAPAMRPRVPLCAPAGGLQAREARAESVLADMGASARADMSTGARNIIVKMS